jgi:hypothetical protein
MACTQSHSCPFVRLFSGKASLRVWSRSYCEGLWSECARYHVISDGGVPPSTLLPNGRSLDHQDQPWQARGAA